MKRSMLVLCLVVLITAISGFDSFGQMNAKEGILATANLIDDSSKRERSNAVDSSVELYLKKPAVLHFKNGAVLRGYLLPGAPEDADTVVVEVNGRIIGINFDELSKLVMDPELLDRVKKVADNNLKARLDGLVIRLQNVPGSRAHLIFFGTPAETRRVEKVSRNYMTARGIEPARIEQVDRGKCGSEWILEMWILQPTDTAPEPKCRE